MHSRKIMLPFALLALLVAGCKKNNSTAPAVQIQECAPVTFSSLSKTNTYIVMLKEEAGAATKSASLLQARQIAAAILKKHNIETGQLQTVLNSLKGGYIARLSALQARELKSDTGVEVVEKDRVIILGTDCFTVVSPSTAQWGVRRVGVGDGTGKRVWIIDTGIDMDHPDLNVDKTLSKSFVSGETSADDNNGHGTHVAGIIGALNNSSGVLGVASGATLVALKALNSDGEGNTSGLLMALNYIGQNAQAGDVVNMSLGADTISDALDNAVRTLAERGLLFAIAAGNEGKRASLISPARVNHQNIYTVSAVDSLGNFASFSNFGNDAVDLAAPGVNIVSTYTNGRYARLSGTSMAAPHVAGLLLLRGRNIHTKGTALNDPDGVPDPIAAY